MRSHTVKTSSYTVRRCLVISIYIAACYCALIGADTYTFIKIYRTLTEKPVMLDALVAKSFVERVEFNKGAENGYTSLKCGLLEVSSRMPVFFLIMLPGFLVFFLVFMFLRHMVSSNRRGFCVLFSFTSICLLVGSLNNHILGIGWHPSTTVLLTSFFYGALFWYIVNLSPAEFDENLKGLSGNTENLRILYDYTKFCWNVIVTLFLGICITLAWNISRVFTQQKYEESGLAPILIRHTIWLVFWGSLGLLGFSGTEVFRRLSALVRSLRHQSEAEDRVCVKSNIKTKRPRENEPFNE